jgi:hypothetical protein
MRTVLEIPSGYETSDRIMIQIVRAIGVINVKNAYVEIRNTLNSDCCPGREIKVFRNKKYV